MTQGVFLVSDWLDGMSMKGGGTLYLNLAYTAAFSFHLSLGDGNVVGLLAVESGFENRRLLLSIRSAADYGCFWLLPLIPPSAVTHLLSLHFRDSGLIGLWPPHFDYVAVTAVQEQTLLYRLEVSNILVPLPPSLLVFYHICLPT